MLSFQFGGSDTTASTFSVGDTYGATTKLAVGSVSVTGTATMSGTTTISGNLIAAYGITIIKGTSSCIAADNGGTGIILQTANTSASIGISAGTGNVIGQSYMFCHST